MSYRKQNILFIYKCYRGNHLFLLVNLVSPASLIPEALFLVGKVAAKPKDFNLQLLLQSVLMVKL